MRRCVSSRKFSQSERPGTVRLLTLLRSDDTRCLRSDPNMKTASMVREPQSRPGSEALALSGLETSDLQRTMRSSYSRNVRGNT